MITPGERVSHGRRAAPCSNPTAVRPASRLSRRTVSAQGSKANWPHAIGRIESQHRKSVVPLSIESQHRKSVVPLGPTLAWDRQSPPKSVVPRIAPPRIESQLSPCDPPPSGSPKSPLGCHQKSVVPLVWRRGSRIESRSKVSCPRLDLESQLSPGAKASCPPPAP